MNHLVHFVMDAASQLDSKPAKINARGTGDAQYPPAMMLGLLKAALGFRRFSLRGLAKVNSEWTLVTRAYNLKRLFHMKACLQTA